MRRRLRMLGTHFFDGVPRRFDGRGKLLRIALAADVHEVHFRLIEEEMIVQAADFKTAGKRGIYRRRHFILKNNGVAHDHRAMGRWRESRPRTQSGGGLERHPVYRDWYFR